MKSKAHFFLVITVLSTLLGAVVLSVYALYSYGRLTWINIFLPLVSSIIGIALPIGYICHRENERLKTLQKNEILRIYEIAKKDPEQFKSGVLVEEVYQKGVACMSVKDYKGAEQYFKVGIEYENHQRPVYLIQLAFLYNNYFSKSEMALEMIERALEVIEKDERYEDFKYLNSSYNLNIFKCKIILDNFVKENPHSNFHNNPIIYKQLEANLEPMPDERKHQIIKSLQKSMLN